MIKDIVIAILAGIAIAQRITQPGDPERPAVVLMIAMMVFVILPELEDLWDKRHQIRQRISGTATEASKGVIRILRQACSRIRWWRICLRTYPAELAQRRRRRQMMREYIQRLRSLPPEERGRNPEESEA